MLTYILAAIIQGEAASCMEKGDCLGITEDEKFFESLFHCKLQPQCFDIVFTIFVLISCFHFDGLQKFKTNIKRTKHDVEGINGHWFAFSSLEKRRLGFLHGNEDDKFW